MYVCMFIYVLKYDLPEFSNTINYFGTELTTIKFNYNLLVELHMNQKNGTDSKMNDEEILDAIKNHLPMQKKKHLKALDKVIENTKRKAIFVSKIVILIIFQRKIQQFFKISLPCKLYNTKF